MAKVSVLEKKSSKSLSSGVNSTPKNKKVLTDEVLQSFGLALFRTTVDNKLIYCNSLFISLLGYSSINQIKSISLASIYRNPLTVEEIIHSLYQGENVNRKVVTLVTKEDDDIIVLLSAVAKKDKRGKIKYFDVFIEKENENYKEKNITQQTIKSFQTYSNLEYLLNKSVNFNTVLKEYIKKYIPDDLFNDIESVIYFYNGGWLIPENLNIVNHPEYLLPIPIDNKKEEIADILETFRSGKEIITNNTHKINFLKRHYTYKNSSILSFAVLPLIHNSICMGVLYLMSNRPNFFSPNTIKYFHKLIIEISPYFYKTFDLYKYRALYNKSSSEPHVFHDVSDILAIQMYLDKTVENCFSVLKNAFHSAKLYFVDDNSNYLELLSFFVDVHHIPLKRIAKSTFFSGRAVTEKRVIIVNDSHSEEVIKIDSNLKDQPRHSFASIPIIFQDKVIGVLTVSSRRYNYFDNKYVFYCEIIAQQLALALNNAVQYFEAQKGDKHLLQLNNTINRLSKYINLGDILNESIEVFKEMGFIYINIYETSCNSNDTERIKLISNYNTFKDNIFSKSNKSNVLSDTYYINNNEKLIKKAIKSLEPIIIKDTHSEEFLREYIEYESYEKHSLALFPIKYNEEKMCVIVLAHRTEEIFNPKNADFLLSVCKQLALIIDNANIYTENIKKLSSHVPIADITKEYFNFFIAKNTISYKVFVLKDDKLTLFDSYYNSDVIPNYPDFIYDDFLLLINECNAPVIFNSSHSSKLKEIWEDVTSYEEHSIGIFPIKYGDTKQGFFSLAFDNPNYFDESTIGLISNITNYFGLLLKNLQLHEEEMDRSKYINFVNELGHKLNQEIDLIKCCKIIITNISNVFDFDGFFMSIYEKDDTLSNVIQVDIVDGQKVYFFGPQQYKMGELMKEIFQTYKPVLLLREHENEKLHGLLTYGNDTRRSLSLMYAPLLSEGKAIGIVSFNSYKKNAFSQKDFDLFVLITSHLSVIMRNGILYQKLSDSENKYKTLFYHSPEAIFSFDQNGIMLAANPEALKLFLANENDVIGKPIADFLSQTAQDFYYKHHQIVFNKFFDNSKNKRVFEIMGRNNKCFEFILTPIVEGTQEINSVVAIIRDITSEKEAERTNKLLQQQELESKKHDFVVNIIKNILHVFNNMFVNILSRSSFAKTLVNEKEPIYPHLEKIALSAERINELMKQLSLFATGGYYSDVKSLNLNKTIQFFYFSKKSQIETEIDFQLELIEPAPFVISNNDQIIVMLEKLLTNSIEAVANNTKKRIVIKTSVTVVNEMRMFRAQKIEKGNYGLITITDNGCGINDEVVSKLYEPFNTTKEYYRGLSLASIYGMLMSMNGLISIVTKVGEGTKVRIWLPLAKE